MNQINESQRLQQQNSLNTSNQNLRQLQQLPTKRQLINLNKHTSFVFAITTHNVVLEESFDKWNEYDESEEIDKKRDQWETKLQQQQGKPLVENKRFIISAGADKNIFLWEIDFSNNSKDIIRNEQLAQLQGENFRFKNLENQVNDNSIQQDFSQKELDLHHVIIPLQQNLYEFVTCLLSVELNQNETYLIAGYESNQIIRYQIKGEYWMRGINNMKYKLKLQQQDLSILKLSHHNDSVRSMVYFNDQLCSCGDDMQLLIQNIKGVVLKRFYFDSIIENLYIWNDYLFFHYYAVELQPCLDEDLNQSSNNLQQVREQQIEQQRSENHIYKYGLQECFMLLGKNQIDNFQIQLNKLDDAAYYKRLEDAYDKVDKITCFELSDRNNIIYSTEGGKLIQIQDPLSRRDLEQKVDYYHTNEEVKKEYQYRILLRIDQVRLHELNSKIMSFIKYEMQFYVFCKQDLNPILYITQKNNERNRFEIIESHNNIVQYLETEIEIKSYEVFLQSPLLIQDKRIILLCGDQSNLQSAPEIIRNRQKPHTHLEIEQLVMQDMRKKILNDEMNTIQFYDIVQPDQDEMIASLKDSSKKPIKLHKRINRTDLENKLRAKLSNEPGSKLLLQEIYEKLEEDPGNYTITVNKKFHQEEQFKADQQYKPESDDQLVANLDTWYKGIKRKLKDQQDKQKQKQEQQSITDLQVYLGLSDLQKQERTQSLQQFRKGDLRNKSKGQQNISTFPKLNVDSTQIETQQSSFKSKLLSSLSKISAIKKIEMINQDHSLTKQLDKYLQQGATLTQQELAQIELAKAKQFGEGQRDGALIFDYTIEGLKSSLHTMIKMQLTTFQNSTDRAQFYEKQTNQILQSIYQKLDKQKKIVIKNEQELEVLRIENHQIHQKLRAIQDFIKDRKEDLKGINKKPQSTNNSPNVKNNSSQVDNYMIIAIKQNELESQIEQMNDNYNKFQQQMKLNSVQIQKLEYENSKLNKNNKALLKSIQGFLQELLKLGLDCRSQGLSWIIKAIWDSGEKIADSNFPPFLDSKGRDFLLVKTRKTIELNELFKKAHQLFSNCRESSIDTGNNSIVSLLSKNHFSQIDSIEIKKQHLNQIKLQQQNDLALLMDGLSPMENELIQKTFTQIFQSKQTLNDIMYLEASKKIQKMFKQDGVQEQSIVFTEINNQEKDKLIKEYQLIQKDIEMKEIQFRKFEETELQRLMKEIEYKNYLARFNIEALQLLAAQFGYARGERELIKYGMLHKMFNN